MNVIFLGTLRNNSRTGGEYFLSKLFNYLKINDCRVSELDNREIRLLSADGNYLQKNLLLYKKLKSVPPNTIVIQNILNVDYLKYFLTNILIHYKRKDLRIVLIVQQIYQFEFGLIKRIINSLILRIYISSFHGIVTTSNYLKKEIIKLKGNSNAIVAIGAAGKKMKVDLISVQNIPSSSCHRIMQFWTAPK